jgi:tetratricopeptide (TPR) repeat protein
MKRIGNRNSFFMVSSLVGRLGIHTELATLLQRAEDAQFTRDAARLSLAVLRLKEHAVNRREQSCADYFEALLALRAGLRDEAANRFALLLEHAPLAFISRGLMSLGCIEARKGEFGQASRLINEAYRLTLRVAPGDPIMVTLLRDRAILHSLQGDHHSALRLLAEMEPLAQEARSIVTFDYYNSLAEELKHTGALEAAAHFSRIALSHPFALRFPEWIETAQEISLQRHPLNRSIIITPRLPDAIETKPIAKILPFISPPRPGVNQRRMAMIAKLIDDLIEVVANPKASEPLLKFIDRLVVEGATDDQIHRMTKQLNRKIPQRCEEKMS